MLKLPIVRFNLKKPKSDEETLILLFYRYRGQKLQYSTGLYVLPKDWDAKSNRAYLKENRKDLFDLNDALEELKKKCVEIYIEYEYGNISVTDFKKLLKQDKGSRNTENSEIKENEIIQFLDEEQKRMESSKMNGNTLKTYRTHFKQIREYLSSSSKMKLTRFKDVNFNFRDAFVDWMSGKDIQLAYGNKILKTLRQYCEIARRKGLHENIDYLGSGWTIKAKKAKGDIISLSEKEIKYLNELKLTGHLAKIRDVLLIGCCTGQRYSDFSRYEPHHFFESRSGIKMLKIISTKTGTPTIVPLNIFPFLIPILEKHEYKTPNMSQQKFNDGLKKLIKLAGFNDQILVIEQYIGRQVRIEKSYVPKYELVSSHIARRSFATILYQRGLGLEKLIALTGHSSESQLKHYIGLDNNRIAEEIGEMFR